MSGESFQPNPEEVTERNSGNKSEEGIKKDNEERDWNDDMFKGNGEKKDD